MSKPWTALLLVAGAACAGTVRIDFGTETSPVRPGFLRVTDRTAFGEDTAVGWLKADGLVARDNPVPRDWKPDPSRGRDYPPPIYTTDLRQDCVQGTGAATLAVRVPDGAYRVWLLCGSAGGHRSQVWNVVASCPAPPASPDWKEAATFAGPFACRVLQGRAAATGQQLVLALDTKSRWVVNALLVVPEAEWETVRTTEVVKLEQEVFLLPDDVLAKWKHTPHKDDAPMPAPTEAEVARGFLVYHRPYLTTVWPNTVPRREECEPTVRAFASRDEYEPLTFTLLPLRDLDEVAVRIGALRTDDGQAIPGDDICVRYVRYMHVRPNYSTHGIYYRAPDVLMPFVKPQSLARGESFRVWATVHVDAFAPAGLYTGEAVVTVGAREAARVPLVLRVLPIKLQKDLSLVYGTYYHHPYDEAANAPDAFSRQWWRHKAEAEAADMAAHGLNAIVSGINGRMDDKGRWQLDFDGLDAKLDLCRRHGLTKPVICHIPTSHIYARHMKAAMGSHLRLLQMPPQAFFDDLTACVRAIEAERQRRQWPELLYYPVDEPSESDLSVKFMVEVMKAIKRREPIAGNGRGARTYVTADPAHEAFAPLKPVVDVWCCQPFTFPREKVLADMKERGIEYWCYPNHIAGENDHTPAAGARMTYGFGFWRSGFRALTPWIYQSVVSDPWNYLDGGYMDFFNRTDDDGRPIPVALWEAYREGIDDGRYITTLGRAIARAREAGHAKLADETQAELQYVWDAIRVQEKYKHEGLWDPALFDRYRWLLARQILRIQEALQ
ncbi:MAG: hypothetical protein FJ290_01500 [Planctomycetes bacterium]|nr:hypothetical protein [Planctomycetota bacterium]